MTRFLGGIALFGCFFVDDLENVHTEIDTWEHRWWQQRAGCDHLRVSLRLEPLHEASEEEAEKGKNWQDVGP